MFSVLSFPPPFSMFITSFKGWQGDVGTNLFWLLLTWDPLRACLGKVSVIPVFGSFKVILTFIVWGQPGLQETLSSKNRQKEELVKFFVMNLLVPLPFSPLICHNYLEFSPARKSTKSGWLGLIQERSIGCKLWEWLLFGSL